jgi:hypothetical protein
LVGLPFPVKTIKNGISKREFEKIWIEHYFKMLEPLLLKEASRNDEFGIVRK